MKPPPAAFTIRIADTQDAKWSLGIVNGIALGLSDHPDPPGLAWVDFLADPWSIVLTTGLTPEFASWCLWHELAHVRQVEWDYAGDVVSFLNDYRDQAWLDWDRGESGPQDERVRRFNLTPWEAEAHLTAWENRMTPLTGPGHVGAAERAHPPDAARFMERSFITPEEVTTEGLAYRHGMRD